MQFEATRILLMQIIFLCTGRQQCRSGKQKKAGFFHMSKFKEVCLLSWKSVIGLITQLRCNFS
jgi:hypothetical protein